ncbi:hypothetical protein RP726_12995 [Candidatus Methylospira mobilis]|uniref:hypothetical protein n=1 Tax=Candidatus Methylospira mobilis TaxID=1808979 RepID=UPI0028E4DCF6|nr:hypothetical protein [Candidatus Methylospira mobilis]WNV03373.1 hypothetical protein RP726_12995 [Candidatus Methylospira mobilis]
MYSSKTSYVLGFHGLDEEVGKKVLNGEDELRHSNNSYDWFGNGVYFWENSEERARQFVEQARTRSGSAINKPFVIGAIIDLGTCLDLLDQKWLDFIRLAYDDMMLGLKDAGDKEPPTNSSFGVNDFDFKKRELDCAVIRYAVQLAEVEENIKFDSVRAAFWEGDELYPNAGFRTHNHIQLSVINPDCIKGIFLPRKKVSI